MGPALCWVMLGPLPLAGTSFAGSAHLGLSPVESRETLEDPRESQVVHTFERYARDLERGKLPDLPGPATLRVLTGMLEDPQWVPEVVGPLLDIFGMVEATAGTHCFEWELEGPVRRYSRVWFGVPLAGRRGRRLSSMSFHLAWSWIRKNPFHVEKLPWVCSRTRGSLLADSAS